MKGGRSDVARGRAASAADVSWWPSAVVRGIASVGREVGRVGGVGENEGWSTPTLWGQDSRQDLDDAP